MSKTHDTKIEWAGKRWTVVHGCSPCSPGCDNCYAEAVAKQRLAGRHGYPPAPRHFDVVCREDRLLTPLSATTSADWFCTPMGDLFHEQVPDAFLDRVFTVMARCYCCDYGHTFKIFTKRPQRMLDYLSALDLRERLLAVRLNDAGYGPVVRKIAEESFDGVYPPDKVYGKPAWPLPNVALGVTCCNQAEADRNIPLLLASPAALRFVSCEPLLEEVNLRLRCPVPIDCVDCPAPDCTVRGNPNQLDWVIAGCESLGARPGRPADLAWFRSLRDQCTAAGMPFMLKQFADPATGKLLKHCPPLDGVAHAAFPEGWEAVKGPAGGTPAPPEVQ